VINQYKICNRCIYDSTVPNISFNSQNICNYCDQHDELEKEYPLGADGKKKLELLINQIKKAGRKKKYDCVIGVSGGCDSSFLLYKLVSYGLRPLAVHFDNTWNSAISTMNIAKVTSKLGIDLFTYVVDNKEYDEIYKAFLLSGVPDIEAPTDIGIATTQYLAAAKYNIKYIIEGHSFRTEGISPLGWLYMDGKYIQSVIKNYSNQKIKTFPNLTLFKQLKWMVLNRFKRVRPLYYMDYNKKLAMEILKDKFNWEWYGGHHLENQFTAFYHRYFMPKKFAIDQRLLGYAALTRSGQIIRDDALEMMKASPSGQEIDEILYLVKKRLCYSDNEFQSIMNIAKKNYKDFKTYKKTFEKLKPFFYIMYKLDLVPKSFYIKYTKSD
tara:strand:+ start:1995 stop:3140 length:1146 start_codon:yes stop_codon:yes gene_type:complete